MCGFYASYATNDSILAITRTHTHLNCSQDLRHHSDKSGDGSEGQFLSLGVQKVSPSLMVLSSGRGLHWVDLC